MPNVTIATLNIAAASKERARRLLDEWIIPTACDVYVLTETSDGEGTALILSEFQNAGWATFRRQTIPNDRGTLIASRLRAVASPAVPATDPVPGRTVILDLDTNPQLQLIGMYVPNRGNDWTKTERKRAFLDYWLRFCSTSLTHGVQRVLVGDLNIVPVGQRPKFLPQNQFEYDWITNLDRALGLYDAALRHGPRHESTWVAHTGEGYTYDHIFPQKTLVDRVASFRYDHAPRETLALTDHSALLLTVAVDSAEPLPVGRLGQPKQGLLF